MLIVSHRIGKRKILINKIAYLSLDISKTMEFIFFNIGTMGKGGKHKVPKYILKALNLNK